ncbi:MAG: oligosaccharide flippase family protein [candidate division Zixibacteria bacterium]|nr:oligosaccharide flippase family protein [candidate division Zixibacteria bacterium]
MINLLVRNTSINLITETLTGVFGMAVFMVAGRVLGPEKFGIYGFAMLVGMVWSQIPAFGFDKLVARDIGKDSEKAPLYFSHIFSAKLLLSIPAMLFVLFMVWIQDYAREKELVIVIVNFTMIAFTFVTFISAFFRALQRAEYEAFLRILLRVGNLILGISTLLAGFGLLGFTLSQGFMGCLAVGIGLIYLKKNFIPLRLSWNFAEMKAYLKRSLPFILLSLLVMFYVTVGGIIVNFYKGDYDTGIYTAAGKLIQFLMFIPTAMTAAFLPAMSKLNSDPNNKALFVRIYGYVFKYLFIIGIAIASGFTVLGEEISTFIYGGEFTESGKPLMIMGWAMVFSFLNFVMVNTIIAVGKEKLTLYVSAGGVVLSTAINLLIVPLYSYNGAAASTLFTELAILSAHFLIIRPYLGARFNFIKLIHKPFWIAIIMGIVLMVAINYVHLLVCVFGGAALFVSLLVVFKVIGFDEIELIKKLIATRGAAQE